MNTKENNYPNHFKELLDVNVSKYLKEKKIDKNSNKTLSYLSWAKAWELVKEYDPSASYGVIHFENNLPYVFDPNTGYMVFTQVIVLGNTLPCHLAVMNGNNKAMKNVAYSYKVKNWQTGEMIEKWVAPATMADISKTIMRCLVKNIAFHGLGLHVYSGEDIPSDDNQNGFDNNQPVKQTVPVSNNVSVNNADICPKCGGKLLLTKKPDKFGNEYYYCGSYKTKNCKYTQNMDGSPRTNQAGEFIRKADPQPEVDPEVAF